MADTSTTETSEREALHMAYDALLDIQKMTGVVVAPSVLRRCYEALASQPVTQSVEPVAMPALPKSIVNAFFGKEREAWMHGFYTGCRMMKEAAPQPSVSQEAGEM